MKFNLKSIIVFLALVLVLVLSVPVSADVIKDDTLSVYPVEGGAENAPLSFEDPDVFEEGKLEIWFGKVNVCDAMVIRCNGETMMIDGGNKMNREATRAFLKALGVHHVNYLFNTHHHEDHLEAQILLVSTGELTADTFLTPYERGYRAKLQQQIEKAVDAKGIEYRTLHDGDTLKLGGEDGALFQFYRWNGSTNPNYSSMFCKVTYHDRSILLLADVTGLAQEVLVAERTDIDWKSDIMKAGHHGYSKQDSNLMQLIQPEFCVITNSYVAKAINQMESLGIPYTLTANGPVYFWTDGGENWYYNRIPTPTRKK